MRLLPLLLFSVLSCALNNPPVAAGEDVAGPPCHVPVKIERTDTKIVFTPCNGEPTEVAFADLKGEQGPAGKPGGDGPRGPAGSGSVDKVVSYCMHDDNTHVARTVRMKQSDIISQRQGWYGMYDHSDSCLPHEEGACNCDQCGFGFHEGPKERKDYFVAALGDSMTTAFNSGGEWSQPQNSWATGGLIDSHVEKIKRAFPDRDVGYINVAFPGVTSSDLKRQLLIVNRWTVDYATVLMGANDLCAGGVDLDHYQRHMEKTLDSLVSHSPNIKILLSAIPDIKQALEVSRDNDCNLVWKKILRNCPAVQDFNLLSHTWEAMNFILETVALKHKENVIFANDVNERKIEPGDISKVDCFHASVSGQQKLADSTWKLGWYEQ